MSWSSEELEHIEGDVLHLVQSSAKDTPMCRELLFFSYELFNTSHL